MRHPYGLIMTAALGMAVSAAGAAAPAAHFPYLPGGTITQMGEGGGHLFAVAGFSRWGRVNAGGHFLYSRHPDSAAWTLRRSSPTSGASSLQAGPIHFLGTLGARSLFNLEDGKAYSTVDGGATFTRVADQPFQTKVAGFGSLAFAVLGNMVHTSADGGVTWTRTSTQLVAEQLVAVDSLLYARGDKIWRSDDSGRTWQERMEGLPPSRLGGSLLHGLYRYDGRIVASTLEGAFVRSSPSSPWTSMGPGSRYLRRMFNVGSELMAESNTRFHRYDPELADWQEYAPWAFPKPMDMVDLGSICDILVSGPRWIVGNAIGLMAYDPGSADYSWFDAGIHRTDYAEYGALSGTLVAAHRHQLLAVPPGGVPTLLRESRKPGARSGSLSLVSIEPADSVLWAYGDSTLFRLAMSAGIPSIRDSVRVRPGRYFCQGRDILGIISVSNVPSGLGTDSVVIRVSRDAGATFQEHPHRLGLTDATSYPGFGKIVAAYLWNDTAWLWDGRADYHAFDLAAGGYRFGETSIPPQTQVGGSPVPLHAVSTRYGMVVKQGSSILVSADGGLTWTLGTRGIVGQLAGDSRIQKLGGRLFFTSGENLYHTEEAVLNWTRTDLKALAGASGGVSGAMVAEEGIYVQRSGEDVVLLPWADAPTSARPILSSPSPGRAGRVRASLRENGLILRRNGVGFSLQGRVVE